MAEDVRSIGIRDPSFENRMLYESTKKRGKETQIVSQNLVFAIDNSNTRQICHDIFPHFRLGKSGRVRLSQRFALFRKQLNHLIREQKILLFFFFFLFFEQKQKTTKRHETKIRKLFAGKTMLQVSSPADKKCR